LKFYYATQVQAAPPTIVIQCNRADDLKESYKRYMVKGFRKRLGFDKIPLRIFFRNKSEKKKA
jgi:GTP-binding protein